jgi:hypothetical protein
VAVPGAGRGAGHQVVVQPAVEDAARVRVSEVAGCHPPFFLIFSRE